MPKSVKFTSTGSSSSLGSFEAGDIARNLPDSMADHLVNEAKCAEYLNEKQAQPPAKSAPPAPQGKRKR